MILENVCKLKYFAYVYNNFFFLVCLLDVHGPRIQMTIGIEPFWGRCVREYVTKWIQYAKEILHLTIPD